MNLNPKGVRDASKHIINQTRDINGTLISIWHNDTFSDINNWIG